MSLWRVERPTSKLSEMESGTFWDFLNNLPSALANLSVPQEPTVILTILPTVYLWQNVRTTLISSWRSEPPSAWRSGGLGSGEAVGPPQLETRRGKNPFLPRKGIHSILC